MKQFFIELVDNFSYIRWPIYLTLALLIVLGVAGILPPTTSALLHNTSTLAISLKSMTNLLPAQGPEHQ